jgi:P-type E1-E2 ATPase
MKTAFVPLTIIVGTGRGASAGVLIKNVEALEVMEKIDTLVVDKTGTLTEGKPRLVSVIPASGKNEDEILRRRVSSAGASTHSPQLSSTGLASAASSSPRQRTFARFREKA